MKRLVLVLVLAFGVQIAFAQFKVVKASDESAGSGTSGVFYALPKTCFKIEVSLSKTEIIPGPYSEYAEKFLGLENVNRTNKSQYEIIDVAVNSFSRPDPEQIYFVEYSAQDFKDDKSFLLNLSDAGVIVGINLPVGSVGSENFKFEKDFTTNTAFDFANRMAAGNMFEKVDTVIRRINIDTLSIEKNFYRSSWQQKSSEQKAKDAAELISRIKENRFLLLSGYQEVNYGQSIEYMDRQLQEMYNENLSLFIGITKNRILKYTFLFVPDESSKNIAVPIFKFSESTGIADASSGTGQHVNIKLQTNGLEDKIGTFAKAKSSAGGENLGYYYRMPEFADVVIELNSTKLFEANMMVGQFGIVAKTPSQESKIEFCPNSGEIKSIKIK
jgi:Domain of unknown function (DUF4831)